MMASELTVGDKAPAFSLPDERGETAGLKRLNGIRWAATSRKSWRR